MREPTEASVGEHDIDARLSELARAGDFDALFALVDAHPSGDPDVVAYLWLNVASDFGHADADDLIDDAMETTSLRFDDDQFVTGHVHLELAIAYLTGRYGLPVDHDKARRHVGEMLARHYPDGVVGGDELLAEASASLSISARAVFDEALASRG